MTRHVLLSTAFLCVAASPSERPPPMPVTSDTPEYCISLADQLAGAPSMPAHALALWRSGRSLCLEGDVLHGLARIRRALMMVRGAAE